MPDCLFYSLKQYHYNGERDRQDYEVSRPCKRIDLKDLEHCLEVLRIKLILQEFFEKSLRYRESS